MESGIILETHELQLLYLSTAARLALLSKQSNSNHINEVSKQELGVVPIRVVAPALILLGYGLTFCVVVFLTELLQSAKIGRIG